MPFPAQMQKICKKDAKRKMKKMQKIQQSQSRNTTDQHVHTKRHILTSRRKFTPTFDHRELNTTDENTKKQRNWFGLLQREWSDLAEESRREEDVGSKSDEATPPTGCALGCLAGYCHQLGWWHHLH
jgi:hypothetical protein